MSSKTRSSQLSVVGGTDVGDLPANDIVVARRRIEALEGEVADLRRRLEFDNLRIRTEFWLRQIFEKVLESRSRFCFLLIDLDNFKLINDQNGSHTVGDEALIFFANMLQRECRDYDAAARRQGDEFVVLLSGCGMNGVTSFVQRLRTALREERFVSPGGEYEICFSYGAVACGNGQTYEEAYGLADQLCYIAKKKKKN